MIVLKWPFEVVGYRAIGRHTYQAHTSAHGHITVVVSTGSRPANRCEAQLRRLLHEHAGECENVRLPMPPVIHSLAGRTCSGEPAWFVTSDYAPGRDLTQTVRSPDTLPTMSLLGCAVGDAMASLHRAGTSLQSCPRHADSPGSCSAYTVPDALHSATSLLARLVEAPLIAGLDPGDLGRLRQVIPRLVERLKQDDPQSGAISDNGLIHADAHGGNMIVDLRPGMMNRRTTLIDGKLVHGDCAFDLACLSVWAAEVLSQLHSDAFLAGFRIGYTTIKQHCWTTTARWELYQAVRSLGRLAYYIPSQRRWSEPFGPARMDTHLRLLEALATSQPTGDDPHRSRDALSFLNPDVPVPASPLL